MYRKMSRYLVCIQTELLHMYVCLYIYILDNLTEKQIQINLRIPDYM